MSSQTDDAQASTASARRHGEVPLVELRTLVSAGKSDAEIAKHFAVADRTVLRWRKKHSLESRWAPETAPHSTPGRYNSGCRCGACRATNRIRAAKARERRSGTTPTEHGASGYSNWGCRCNVCAEAGRQLNAVTRERAKAGLITHIHGGRVANCPCADCRVYYAAKAKESNDRSREAAHHYRVPGS